MIYLLLSNEKTVAYHPDMNATITPLGLFCHVSHVVVYKHDCVLTDLLLSGKGQDHGTFLKFSVARVGQQWSHLRGIRLYLEQESFTAH